MSSGLCDHAGTAPIGAIHQVPTSADLVIVDQFEELFTLTEDESTRSEFVRLLAARGSANGPTAWSSPCAPISMATAHASPIWLLSSPTAKWSSDR